MVPLVFAAILIVSGLWLLITGDLPLQGAHSIHIGALTSDSIARIIGGIVVVGGLYLIRETSDR